MSGSVQSAVTSSLEFLALTDSKGIPSKELHQLVESEEKDRPAILRSVLINSYPFLFSGPLDLKRATTKQVEEAFRAQGVSGSTIVKCIAFFLAASKEAGVQVSPHVKTPTLVRTAVTRKQSSLASAAQPDEDEDADKGVGSEVEIPSGMQQIRLPLLNKDAVILALPTDFNSDDWKFLRPILEAYITRLVGDGG
jgi:hypothetical protein